MQIREKSGREERCSIVQGESVSNFIDGSALIVETSRKNVRIYTNIWYESQNWFNFLYFPFFEKRDFKNAILFSKLAISKQVLALIYALSVFTHARYNPLLCLRCRAEILNETCIIKSGEFIIGTTVSVQLYHLFPFLWNFWIILETLEKHCSNIFSMLYSRYFHDFYE